MTKKRPAAGKATRKRAQHPATRKSDQSLALVVRDPAGLIPPPTAMIAPWALSQEPTVNVAFMGKLKLTKDQISALRRKVVDAEVDWKPSRKDGPPDIPYLSHNGYRDRLDEAFGLGGWAMAPTVAPKEKDGVVYCQYALIIDGTPRFFAWGEQAYHANNKQMTYGDALEGAKSNAIIRCGKELGIARDLWNRRFREALKRRVPVKDRLAGGWVENDEPSESSRRREDPPPPKATARTGDEDALITLPQRTRLFKIGKDAGRTKSEITTWIKHYLGVTDSGQITRGAYDGIVALVEKPGPLPRKEKVHEPEVLPPLSDADLRWGLK